MSRPTPLAAPVALPKLVRMSLRTTPSCASTSGPLEPSPGYGPAVSSGMVVHSAAVVVLTRSAMHWDRAVDAARAAGIRNITAFTKKSVQ